MTIDDFMTELQDIFQRDDEIHPNDALEDMEEWDSMAIMACMVWFESRLGIKQPYNFFMEKKTVQDLIDAGQGQIA